MNIEKKVCLAGEIYFDLTVGPDCDGGTELRKVDAVSFTLQGGGESIHLNIEGFRIRSGQTIADSIYGLADTIIKMVDAQKSQEEAEMEKTFYEDH